LVVRVLIEGWLLLEKIWSTPHLFLLAIFMRGPLRRTKMTQEIEQRSLIQP